VLLVLVELLTFCPYFAKWINSFMIAIITDIEKSNIANSLIGRSVRRYQKGDQNP
jgi:hypothetical protein